MKRLPFEPPTEHYDDRLETIDEQICDLIKQRKELSATKPSFPPKQLISRWSKKYELYEDFINGVFGHFLNEEMYRPVVEPKGFLKNIPILKSFEKDELFYSVTFLRQYENASVIHFNIDQEDSDDMFRGHHHTWFDLSIDDGKGTEYDCRNEGGGGSRGHTSYTFIVSPALPDDASQYKLVFKECRAPCTKPTGFEFVI